MSLVNQVLKDLQHRRGAAPDADGLVAAAPIPVARSGIRWPWLVVAAVAVGATLVAIEQLWFAAPAVQPVAVVAQVAPEAVPEVVPQVVPDIVPEVVPEVVAEGEADATLVDTLPAPETEAAAADAETVGVATVTDDAPPSDGPVVAAQPAVDAPRETPVQRTLIVETPRQRGADAYATGVRALADGRRATAESHFRVALSHDAAHHDTRLALVNLLSADGRIREAEALLQEGQRIAPDHAGYAERYARMLFERGDLAGAIGVLDAAAPAVESAPDYHALRAALLQRAGNHDAAADAYGALVAVRPDQGLWWMGLAISLEGAGRPAAARDAYTRAARDARLSTEVARFVHERLTVLDDGQDG